jgi:hypothetical protein
MEALAGYGDALLHVAIGLGLSAAAGFRILIPFFAMSVAASTGHLKLAPEMAWIGTQGAMVAFGIAAVIEVLIYFIPVLNNFMDMIEVPAAAIAGTILTATVTSDLNPFLRWSLAAIAGGSIAGTTEAFMSVTRLASTAAAGPAGNVAVGMGELAGSGVLSILSILLPILTLVVLAVLVYLVVQGLRKRGSRRRRFY